MNFFNQFIKQLNILFSHISESATNFTLQNPVKAIFIFISFIFLIILVSISKTRFLSLINKDKQQIIPKLLPPIIIYFFIYYFYYQDKSNAILMLLHSITMFWLLISLIYLPFLYIKNISKFKISFIPPLIIIGLLLNLTSEFLYNSPKIKDSTKLLFIASQISTKIIVIISIYFYLKALLAPILDVLSENFKIINKIKPLFKYYFIFLLLAGILWIFNIINFGINLFLSIAIVLILSSILYYIDTNKIKWVEKYFKSDRFEKTEQLKIARKLSIFTFLIVSWIFYLICYKLLNFDEISKYLSSFYIINTSLIKISFLKIFASIYLFITLRTFLYIFSRFLRTFNFEENGNLTSNSIETLVYNLGSLFIFMLASVELGITWKIIIPIAGAIGIGIGVGIQTILNNYISGFIILFSKKVKIGDIIELEGNAGRLIGLETDTVFGKVKTIDVFATTIKTFDNVDVAVPNSLFISGNIVNYTQEDNVVRVRVPIGVSYLSDVEKVKKIIMEAILESPYVLKYKQNDVWFNNFGASSLDFYAICWVNINQVKHPRNVRVDIIERVWYKFKENNIEIPYPQQDIWFRNKLKIERIMNQK